MSLRAVRPLRLAALLALPLLAACGFGSPAPTPTPDAAALEPAPRVVADGRVLPARSAELGFLDTGRVAEIFVAEGELIDAGDPLARLDAAELEAAVAQARAAVEEAGAQLELLQSGALPASVAAAEAQVAEAQAAERQAAGRVTAADLQAARDELREAQALLARLTAGPRSTEVEQAQAGVAQAQANLQTQRDSLSAAKTDAELRLQQAANTLRDAQDAYSRIYWDNREREKAPGDLPQQLRDQEAAALRAVENSEAALAQAQVDLERARQAEQSGIAQGEAQLRDAQARLDQQLAGADADQIAGARARVSAAQARIAALTGGAREGEIAAAQAGVAQAQAALDEVTAGPRSAEIAVAEARVRARQADLRRAEVALERATLLAPFAGTVVELNLELGEQPPAEEPALVLADMSAWKVETSDLTELDVVNVRVGDAVTLSFDALPDLILPGVVTRVESLGKTFQGDVLYTVAVEPQEWDERLRWNMTATVTVEAE
jgi:multidrug efflux pump subunit AcrA (membrane-fusion protein)